MVFPDCFSRMAMISELYLLNLVPKIVTYTPGLMVVSGLKSLNLRFRSSHSDLTLTQFASHYILSLLFSVFLIVMPYYHCHSCICLRTKFFSTSGTKKGFIVTKKIKFSRDEYLLRVRCFWSHPTPFSTKDRILLSFRRAKFLGRVLWALISA